MTTAATTISLSQKVQSVCRECQSGQHSQSQTGPTLQDSSQEKRNGLSHSLLLQQVLIFFRDGDSFRLMMNEPTRFMAGQYNSRRVAGGKTPLAMMSQATDSCVMVAFIAMFGNPNGEAMRETHTAHLANKTRCPFE